MLTQAAFDDVGGPTAVALETIGVTKRFGSFSALDDVSLQFAPAKVHAIVGQNGAGKTTFARLVCGLYEPTSGEVRLAGTPLRSGDVRSTRAQGVDMVHQNFSLPPSFTVAEALELFDQRRSRFATRRTTEAKWQAALERHGSAIAVRRKVRDLSVEARQSLEIIRALEGRPQVLILDEPTAVLAPVEVDGLFARVRELAAGGLTVVTILHKMAEVFAVADTVSVLRDGRLALPTTPIAATTREEVAAHLIGEGHRAVATAVAAAIDSVDHAVDSSRDAIDIDEVGAATSSMPMPMSSMPVPGPVPGPLAEVAAVPRLSLAGVTATRGRRDRPVDGVSLDVHAGEILGIAGIEGNGQETLLDVLCGAQPVTSGTVHLDGFDVTSASVLQRRRRGLRSVPSDRSAHGISATTSLWENLALSDLLVHRRRWFSPRSCQSAAITRLGRWQVRYRSPQQPAGELSGGNVQRAILARELDDEARLFVAGNPTRGLDLAATAFVRASLERLAADGVAVILVSADLDEIRSVSSRICVMRSGRLVAELPGSATVAEIGALMVGAADA